MCIQVLLTKYFWLVSGQKGGWIFPSPMHWSWSCDLLWWMNLEKLYMSHLDKAVMASARFVRTSLSLPWQPAPGGEVLLAFVLERHSTCFSPLLQSLNSHEFVAWSKISSIFGAFRFWSYTVIATYSSLAWWKHLLYFFYMLGVYE